MNNYDSACVISLPQTVCPSFCNEYRQEVTQLPEDTEIVIDFKNINKVDFHFLNTLMSVKKCLSDRMNVISFVNYSQEVQDLFDEIDVQEFLGLSNLVQEHLLRLNPHGAFEAAGSRLINGVRLN